MVFSPKKLKKFVLARDGFGVARLPEKNPVHYVLGETSTGRRLFCVVIQFPNGKGFPVTARPMTRKEKRAVQPMEKTIRRRRLPETDSIEELARFWNTHDLTDFEEELEEAAEPVFVRAKGTSLRIDLPATEAQHLMKIARSKGVTETTVLRQWILERIYGSSRRGRAPSMTLPRTARKTRHG